MNKLRLMLLWVVGVGSIFCSDCLSHHISLQEQEKHLFFEQLLDPTKYTEPFNWKNLCRQLGFAAGAVVVSTGVSFAGGALFYHGSSLACRQEIEDAKADFGMAYKNKSSEMYKTVDGINDFFEQAGPENADTAVPVKNTIPDAVLFDRVSPNAAHAVWRSHVFKRMFLCSCFVIFYLSWQFLAHYKNGRLLHDNRYQKILKRVLDNWLEYRPMVPEVFYQQFDTLHEAYRADGAREFFTEEIAELIVKTAVMQSLATRLQL